jgi:MFS family permease
MSAAGQHEPYAVLRIADFRRLLLARLFVTVSVQIHAMAVGWQIYALTKNPLSLGLIGLVGAFPAIGIALYAGHFADVHDRKRLASGSVLVLMVCMGALAFCSLAGLTTNTLCVALYILIALSGFARGFYSPAIFGLISQIVPRNLYGNAAAWNSTLWQLSAIGGPILGGILYVKLGAGWTYAVATLLLLVSLATISFIQSRTDLSGAPRGGVHDSILEGLRFVFSHQVILGAMALDLFGVLFGGAVALLPIFADQIFHRGPEALGILRAAPSLGAFAIATTLAFRPIRKHAGYIFLFVVAGFGLCMVAFALSTNFWLSVAVLALSGVFDGVSVYIRSTIYQQNTPEDMKGRVAAVNSIFIGSSNEIGEFESGVMAKLLGTVPSVIFGGCATLAVVAITALRAPALRRVELE